MRFAMVDSPRSLPYFSMPRRLIITLACLLSLLTCLVFTQLCLAQSAAHDNAHDAMSNTTAPSESPGMAADHSAHMAAPATQADGGKSGPAPVVEPAAAPMASVTAQQEAEPDPHAAHRAEQDGMGEAKAMEDMKDMPGMDGKTANATAPAQPAAAPANKAADKNAPKAVVPPPNFVERLGETVPEGIKLRDENGNLVDVLDFMDIPTIIVPVFFSCPAGCNTLQSAVAATISQLELKPGKDFRVLTVSFDETDTPELALRKKNNYLAATNYKFPAEEWRYLTGDLDSIKEFMTSIGFPYIRLGPGNFSHPLGVVVLAPGGKVTRYLYGQWFKPFDLTMALNEAAEGKVGLSVKRLVGYCFSYDPESRKYVFNLMRVAGGIILFGAGVLLFVLLLGKKKPKKQNGQSDTDK